MFETVRHCDAGPTCTEAALKYRRRFLLAGTTALAALAALTQWRALAGVLPDAGNAIPAESNDHAAGPYAADEQFDVTHTEAQWRDLLTPAQFAVLREAATERPYSSPLNDEHRVGVFACAGCALQLF